MHRVSRGETIWDIARLYKTSTKDILAANGIREPRRITPGTRLVIPGVKPLPRAEGPSVRVRRGETIWDIALRHRVSMRAILSANGIANPERVAVGTRLVLPAAVSASSVDGDGRWYHVRRGDTLSHIAQRYGLSWREILWVNHLSSARELRAGQKLFIPQGSVEPVIIHTVEQGDTVWAIAQDYKVTPGSIIQANQLTRVRYLKPGMQLQIPGGTSLSTNGQPLRAITLAKHGTRTVGFLCPLRGNIRVTSSYGYRYHPVKKHRLFHHGMDLGAKTGTPVYAAMSGKVTHAGWRGGYGKAVVIQHQDGYSTRYGHLSRIKVSVGQQVKTGALIALSGNTGVSTGPHLHFEIQYQGKSEDPANHIPRFRGIAVERTMLASKIQ